MGLLSSIFTRNEASTSGASYREGVTDELVQQTRARARNRLIGALVLVIAGVLALPMLFDSEPRPLPGSTRIEVKPSAQAAPAPAPSKPAPRAVIEERADEAGTPVDRKPSPAAAAASAASVAEAARKPLPESRSPTSEPRTVQAAPPAAEAPVRKEAARETARPARAADTASDERARALLEGRERPVDAAAAKTRFVVQVAAYADQASLNQARARLEKLGLKTYTQSVRTEAGTRVRLRVGPFNDRDDADRALGRIKGAGLPGSVQTL